MLKSFTLPLTGTPRRLSEVYDAYRDVVLADGAVGLWQLGETSGTTAASAVGTSPPGTITGGVTLNQGGIAGSKAMLFNGTDGSITVPNGDWLAIGTGPLTIEAWVKVASVTQEWVMDFRGAGTVNPGASFVLDPSSLGFTVANGSTGDSTSTLVSDAGGNVWHHLVGTVTRGANDTIALYVDGALKSSKNLASTGWNLTPNRNLVIGAFSVGGGFFAGWLNNVAVYKTALTPQQILTHYQLGLPRTYRDAVLADGALAYWRLGELFGTSAFSEVGSFTGTIGGGVLLAQPGALLDGNTAMTFDGSSGKIAMGNVLSIPGAISIELWTKYAAFGGIRPLVAKLDAGITNGYAVLNHSVTGSIQFLGVSGGPAIFNFTSGTPLTDGRWHHVACTWDGTTNGGGTKIYVDTAVSLGAAATATATGINTDPFLIGSFGTPTTNFFAGSLDDVSIYNYALTPAQIANHYALASVVPAVPPGAAMFDIPYRQLTLSAGPGPIRIGGDPALSSAFTLDEATTPTVNLGRFSTGPLRLSDIWAVGAGATIHIVGVPY